MDETSGEEKSSSLVNKSEAVANERKLIEAAQNGDQRAFGHLIRGHQKRLFRFVYGLLGSFDATEDIVQEAFVKAYQAIDRFDWSHSFYPWLATIARNTALICSILASVCLWSLMSRLMPTRPVISP